MPRCPYRQLHISIPSDALSTYPSLREKTLVAGFIARAIAASRSERVAIYHTASDNGLDVLISILKYLAEPVYLRKKLFPLKPELKYVGILPPLNIPSLNEGFRDKESSALVKVGLIVDCRKGSRAIIDIGEEKEVVVQYDKCRKGNTVMVLIKENDELVVLPRKYGIWHGTYWGYKVTVYKDLNKLIDEYRKKKFKVIGTSRYGEWPGRLREIIRPDSKVIIIFGSPSEGLLEKVDGNVFDVLVNTFPCQGVKSIRLEEAIWSTLALYSSLEYGL
ncbi:hypothetical protein EYM_07640 [Ignicoccus islandicus DSM 13165]|uniref:RNA methyltransferase n=1 Tax=Ignicoccus islandicus DSM 13165 TaxID=940295 RepID=A0A0U2MBT5_9CREN|nr:putative RNA uridine N3 methyltransferase [Ignicoccus islandicus]ALU12797.1 hypothetical protein EYM_07640 [Ignicoccus islandicus DSM 13165]